MAFSMKVASGAVALEKCPHLTPEALAALGESSAPPMKTIKVGKDECNLGGETVLFRHEKTFVSKPLYGVTVCPNCIDEELPVINKIDYDRIGEKMRIDALSLDYKGDAAKYAAAARKAAASARVVILNCTDEAAAKAALDAIKESKPILNGANEANYAAMNALAVAAGVVLGISGKDLDAAYDTVAALEKLGNKNLIVDVTAASAKETFAAAVQLRRAALVKDGDRTAGYPAIVNVGKIASGDPLQQTALASLFTLKYGSIIVLESMSYAQALPLFCLRQNIFTDPQKPMTFEPKIYPLNGAKDDSICAVTVDFALSVFIIQGELERSGIPVNLIVADAGGYSVLTSWAAGKFSAGTIGKFIKEKGYDNTLKNHTLIIPGKVAVLKGELEEALPGWKILVGPKEAVGVVKYLKEM
jgi:acetyl-CoA decarbonylase/synthase complex subunit gamma